MSGDTYTFKKVITNIDDDGVETLELQETTEKDIAYQIDKSHIKEFLSASKFKLHYSLNRKSILRIEEINDYQSPFFPIKHKPERSFLFYYLFDYIRSSLEKDVDKDYFEFSEFIDFSKMIKSKLDENSFDIKKEISQYIQKTEDNKNIFFFDGVFVDMVKTIDEGQKKLRDNHE